MSKKKEDLVKALSEAGHRESALLLKNWGEMDANAEALAKTYAPYFGDSASKDEGGGEESDEDEEKKDFDYNSNGSLDDHEKDHKRLNSKHKKKLKKARDPFSDFPSKQKESAVDKKSREITDKMRTRANAPKNKIKDIKTGFNTRSHGDYEIRSKPAGYQDTDTGGEDAEPRDVHEHKVYHKGKHIGTMHTADADGHHLNIGSDLPSDHEDHVESMINR